MQYIYASTFNMLVMTVLLVVIVSAQIFLFDPTPVISLGFFNQSINNRNKQTTLFVILQLGKAPEKIRLRRSPMCEPLRHCWLQKISPILRKSVYQRIGGIFQSKQFPPKPPLLPSSLLSTTKCTERESVIGWMCPIEENSTLKLFKLMQLLPHGKF